MHTLYQHDPRIPSSSSVTSGEHIGGARPDAHAPLSEPGPLSILHPPSSTSIWIAGRFTSLLHYDRRFWPRLHSTLFSGARLSSLAYLPSPFSPPVSSGLARPPPPSTSSTIPPTSAGCLVAAGAYKGKGSLEIYPLLATPDSLGRGLAIGGRTQEGYKNRQTASRSRILSATPHGARVVFADGDGGLKWVERDGASVVRVSNLAALEAEQRSFVFEDASGRAKGRRNVAGHEVVWAESERESETDSGYESAVPRVGGARRGERDSAEYRSAVGAHDRERQEQAEDVVQRLVPMKPVQTGQDDSSGSGLSSNNGLLIQTGEGRLGLLSFTKSDPLVSHSPAGCGEEEELFEDVEEHQEQRERMHERRYDAAMRAALESQSREMWWVKGLGL